jgi:fluoride exporter
VQQILLIGLGGALGSIGRYGITIGSRQFTPEHLPFGTFGANMMGCFLIGVLAPVLVSGDFIPKAWHLPLTVGFLGGLTTFSSFSLETVRLLDSNDWRYAMTNIFANLLCGTSLTVLGMMLGRKWIT